MYQRKFNEEDLDIDHIFPYGFGGSNEETNLMTVSRICNRNKSASLEYFKRKEGKLKLLENIKYFVKD